MALHHSTWISSGVVEEWYLALFDIIVVTSKYDKEYENNQSPGSNPGDPTNRSLT